jgi:hypothetical protein
MPYEPLPASVLFGLGWWICRSWGCLNGLRGKVADHRKDAWNFFLAFFPGEATGEGRFSFGDSPIK